SYIDLYTHLRSYEEHALNKIKKQKQSSSVVDPLTYLVKTTHQQAPTHSTTTSPLQLTPALAFTSSSIAQSHDDAMLATMKQIANLLILDAEAEAFLADVECTVPFAEPLALTTTNMFQALVNATLSLELDQCLGLSNLWFGRKAQLSQPNLYDGHRLLQPGHAPVTLSNSHETLLETEVYWLSASDIASQSSDPPKPMTPFVHTRLVNSE
nr:hypothetical protein [Tanacetum cinerariifolium]